MHFFFQKKFSFETCQKFLPLPWLIIFTVILIGPPFLRAQIASPTGVGICDDPNHPHDAIWMKYCGGGGGAQTQPSGPSPEQIRQNQLIADARALNQKGLDSFNDGDYDAALDYFQQALDKTPNDAAIQQNLQNANEKIEAKNKFNQGKKDALNDLKGASDGSGTDPDSGLKDAVSDHGGSQGDGLRDIDTHAVQQADEADQEPDAFDGRKKASGSVAVGGGTHFFGSKTANGKIDYDDPTAKKLGLTPPPPVSEKAAKSLGYQKVLAAKQTADLKLIAAQKKMDALQAKVELANKGGDAQASTQANMELEKERPSFNKAIKTETAANKKLVNASTDISL